VLLYDLKAHLIETQTPMPISVALRVIRDAARAGACVHTLANEQNVFQGQRLLYNDGIVVAAFGETLLRDVGVLTVLCHDPAVAGLPAVIAGLSPEELSGPRVAQESSEVFSLGILLWELLANRLSISRRDAQKATSGVISQPIPPLDRIERFGMPLPKELVALVARAIDRDPRRRTPTLEALADAIDELSAPLVGSSEQVGNCIRRLAGANLGETTQSSSWSVGPKSDAFEIDEGSGVPPTNRGRDFEPATVADRQLLVASMLEFRSRNGLSEQAKGQDGLDVEITVAPSRSRLGLIFLFVAILLVAAAITAGLFRGITLGHG
jgi:hypothetical protein